MMIFQVRPMLGVSRALLVLSLLLLPVGIAPGVEVWKVGAAAPDDATLLRTVQSKITGRPGVDVARVEVVVLQGALELSGTVRTLYEREEIEKIASSVRGLVSITNEIRMERIEQPDVMLQREALREIELSPRLRSFGLSAQVQDGVLTLDGEVGVVRDREEAEEAASRLPGIVEIRNRIGLAPGPFDPDLVRRRLERILSNKLIFGGVDDLKVEVRQDGAVTLAGIVPTHVDRTRAQKVAYRIRGVTSVDNQIRVRRFSPPASP